MTAELRPLPRQVLFDVKDLATAPLRWHEHEWTRLGEGAALVLAAYAADTQIVNAFSRNHHTITDRYLHAVTHLGGGYGLDLTVALAAGGFLTHDSRMMDAGIDALESSVWAAGVVTPVIKRVVGRARPIFEEGKHSFHPFNSHDQSFPSGHSTNAFAIAGAIATRYDDSRYIPAIAYTLATSVAVARVNDRVHFPSDVIAGAMIGHAVARSIVNNHRRAHVAVIPQRRGFGVAVTF